jgi:hypothetical protein
MAALYWHNEVRSLSPETQIHNLMSCNELDLRQKWGFSNVRRSELDVSGGKNSVFVSIAHFHIDGPSFWEVVMASADNGDVTKNTVGEVVDKLHHLHLIA